VQYQLECQEFGLMMFGEPAMNKQKKGSKNSSNIKNWEIPNNWKFSSLLDAVGGSPSLVVGGPFGSSLVVNDYRMSGIPIIRLQNVDYFQFIEKDIKYISYEKASELDYHSFKNGDLVITKLGDPIGKTCEVPDFMERGIVVSDVVRIRNENKQLDKHFLLYFLNSPLSLNQINNQVFGSTRPRVNLKQIREIIIPIPPLEEQKRIIRILDEKRKQIDESKKAIKLQLDLVLEYPNAYLREIFHSEKSTTWKKKKISDFAITCSGTTPSRSKNEYYNGTIPWIKTGELKDGLIEKVEEFVTEQAIKETSLKVLPQNTLLVAMYGQGITRGRTGILTRPSTINQACFAILPNPKEYNTRYLQLWFQHNYSRLRHETESRGGNQPNLNGIYLREQEVLLPKVEVQNQIVGQFQQKKAIYEQVKISLQKQLEIANSLLISYFHQAFRGEL
jgi:type I restriction enzyme S subunit